MFKFKLIEEEHWLNVVVKKNHFSTIFTQFHHIFAFFSTVCLFWWASVGSIEVIASKDCKTSWQECSSLDTLRNIDWMLLWKGTVICGLFFTFDCFSASEICNLIDGLFTTLLPCFHVHFLDCNCISLSQNNALESQTLFLFWIQVRNGCHIINKINQRIVINRCRCQ